MSQAIRQSLQRYTVLVRGLSLRVWRLRSEDTDAPKVLFLHGFLDHGLSFLPMLRSLDGKVDAWLVDHRGHGESDWIGPGGQYHFYDYYHDIVEIVQQMDLNKLHVCAHSMGGMIAVGLAALQPDRVASLLLLDGMGPLARSADRAVVMLQDWVAAMQTPGFAGDPQTRKQARRPMQSVQAAADKLCAVNPRLLPARAIQFATTNTEAYSPDDPDDSRVVWRHDPLHRTPPARPFRLDEALHLWKGVHCPVLTIYPEELSPWHPDDLAEREACMPQLQRGTLPGTAHNLHHDAPEVLATVFGQWLAHPGQHPAALQAWQG